MRRQLMLVTGIEYMCRFKHDVARVCYLGLPSRDNVEYLFILFINFAFQIQLTEDMINEPREMTLLCSRFK